jgi:hypothetical protein
MAFLKGFLNSYLDCTHSISEMINGRFWGTTTGGPLQRQPAIAAQELSSAAGIAAIRRWSHG